MHTLHMYIYIYRERERAKPIQPFPLAARYSGQKSLALKTEAAKGDPTMKSLSQKLLVCHL